MATFSMDIPAWKQNLLQKKKRAETVQMQQHHHDDRSRFASMPAWKRDILLRKHAGGKSGSLPKSVSAGDIGLHNHHNAMASPMTKNGVDTSEPHSTANVTLMEADNIDVSASVACGTSVDHLRQQQAILRTDRQVTSSATRPNRNSADSLASVDSSGGGSSSRNSWTESDAYKKVPNAAVLRNEDGAEVTYGRGFVNKIRERFNQISSFSARYNTTTPRQRSYSSEDLLDNSSSTRKASPSPHRDHVAPQSAVGGDHAYDETASATAATPLAAVQTPLQHDQPRAIFDFSAAANPVATATRSPVRPAAGTEHEVEAPSPLPSPRTADQAPAADVISVSSATVFRAALTNAKDEVSIAELPKPNTVSSFRSLFESASSPDSKQNWKRRIPSPAASRSYVNNTGVYTGGHMNKSISTPELSSTNSNTPLKNEDAASVSPRGGSANSNSSSSSDINSNTNAGQTHPAILAENNNSLIDDDVTSDGAMKHLDSAHLNTGTHLRLQQTAPIASATSGVESSLQNIKAAGRSWTYTAASPSCVTSSIANGEPDLSSSRSRGDATTEPVNNEVRALNDKNSRVFACRASNTSSAIAEVAARVPAAVSVAEPVSHAGGLAANTRTLEEDVSISHNNNIKVPAKLSNTAAEDSVTSPVPPLRKRRAPAAPRWPAASPPSQQQLLNGHGNEDDVEAADVTTSATLPVTSSATVTQRKPALPPDKPQQLQKDTNRLNLSLDLKDTISTNDKLEHVAKHPTTSPKQQPPRPQPVNKQQPQEAPLPTKPKRHRRPAPSNGPGSLLIRPASNLVPDNTVTASQFLQLNKYNDVTEGSFAPPQKRPEYYDDSYEDEYLPATAATSMDPVDGGRSDVIQVTNLDDDSPASPDGTKPVRRFEFEGAGVKLARNCLKKSRSGKRDLKFNESAVTTFEYPSYESLIAEFGPPSPTGGEGDEASKRASFQGDEEVPIPAKNTIASGTSAMGSVNLGSYKPRYEQSYELGKHQQNAGSRSRSEDKAAEPKKPEPTDALPAAEDDNNQWSGSANSDMLF